MKLIPVIIVLVVFFNALFGVMICDDQYIINNPNIKNLTFNSANGLLDILTYEIIDFTGLPLSVQVMGFHFINILLHIIVCLLLFQFLELFFTETPSLLGTCLFAVLPVHTENVTWISGRAHLLVGLCFLAIFLLFYHKRYKLALVIFLLAILPGNTQTNIWVHIIPIVLMAYLLIYKEFKKILWVMPYFLISASIILFNWAEIVERIVLMTSSYGKSWINPWSSFIFSIFTHLRLAVFPVNLTIYHEPLIITPRFIVLGTVVFILLCLILPFLYKKAKPILFGVVIYVLFLLPTFSPIPIGWIIAERYIYTSSIFLCLLFAFLVEKFYKEVFIIFLIILSLYAVRTVDRNADYKTEERFWRGTLVVSPFSPKARNNMGIVYARESNIFKAAQEFNNALKIKPDMEEARGNLDLVMEAVRRNIKLNF